MSGFIGDEIGANSKEIQDVLSLTERKTAPPNKKLRTKKKEKADMTNTDSSSSETSQSESSDDDQDANVITVDDKTLFLLNTHNIV